MGFLDNPVGWLLSTLVGIIGALIALIYRRTLSGRLDRLESENDELRRRLVELEKHDAVREALEQERTRRLG